MWDYDSGNQPILFDMRVRGERIKALAEASKNGFLYILNRETGKPVHEIREVPVPTATSRPGEQPWPTQPIPFSTSGKMMIVSPVVAEEIPAETLAGNRVVPMFTPIGPKQISSPGTGGGANYAPVSFSPQTGLLYVNAIDSPAGSSRPPRGYFSAWDPKTGDKVWEKISDGFGQAGSVVTAGGVVFVGSGSNTAGYFYAHDAKTGEILWKFNTGSGVFSSPSIYMVNGEYPRKLTGETWRMVFIDERNSCRSQMAEAIGIALKRPQFVFASAGLSPTQIEPGTVEFMKTKGVDLSLCNHR